MHREVQPAFPTTLPPHGFVTLSRINIAVLLPMGTVKV